VVQPSRFRQKTLVELVPQADHHDHPSSDTVSFPDSLLLSEAFDHHLLIAAQSALTLPAVELYAKPKSGCDLFDLLSQRHLQV
jgi:hypothetical protein